MNSEKSPLPHTLRPGSTISSAAAVCLILLFFMPWFSGCNVQVSGSDLAGGIGGIVQSSPFLLGIPLVGLAVAFMGVKNILRPAELAPRWNGIIIALSAYPLIALLLLYATLQDALNDPLLDLRAVVQVEFGFYGTLLAAVTMMAGAAWEWLQTRKAVPRYHPRAQRAAPRSSPIRLAPVYTPARPRAWLQGQAGGFTSALEITTDLLRIGTGPGCELCLADPNALAEHAVVRYANGRYYLQDLGSPTGTHVNGQRVSVITLQDGALITIGRTLLRFRQQP